MEFSRRDTKVIKGIAVIMMLYHHLFAFPERVAGEISYKSLFEFHGNTLALYLGIFGKLCVYIFIFFSGYGTYLGSGTTDCDCLIASKIKKIYFSYWKVFAIFIPLCMVLNIEGYSWNLETLIWNFLGLQITYNGEWWFYTPYIFLLILFPFFLRILNASEGFWRDFVLIIAINTVIVFIIPTFSNMTWAVNLPDSILYINFKLMLELLPVFLTGILFAKYNLLSIAKEKCVGNICSCLLAIICLIMIFYMRNTAGGRYDTFYTPIFVVALTILLQSRIGKAVSGIFERIGNQSAIIWLTHSFYCYLLCPKLVYAPYYSALIVIWLCVLSYLTALGINKFYNILYSCYLCIRIKRNSTKS